jgi:hypothetical protein
MADDVEAIRRDQVKAMRILAQNVQMLRHICQVVKAVGSGFPNGV